MSNLTKADKIPNEIAKMIANDPYSNGLSTENLMMKLWKDV